MSQFNWTDPGELVDDDLMLLLAEKSPADPSKGYVPTYKFEMRLVGTPEKIGNIDLRVGETERLRMYGGQLAYGVTPDFRGRRYAARACRLLLQLARQHNMSELWITCNPDNVASKRTCELAGAIFVEVVDLPEDIDMYQEGERQKCRYRIDL
ncbi:MAG: GNAT family N-acetyltransferase [Candidatus Sabulitectum sp.]|nr:GNAT family N-acetyltransferase [Candidatus Sabulitectum sp.]